MSYDMKGNIKKPVPNVCIQRLIYIMQEDLLKTKFRVVYSVKWLCLFNFCSYEGH